MSDIGERPGVDKGRLAFQSLHQVGHDRVLEQDGHRTGHAQILQRDRVALPVQADDHPPRALAQVFQAGGQGQDGHQLAGDGDVEAGLAREDRAGGAIGQLVVVEADLDLAQAAVADIDHAVPGDGGRVDVQPAQAALGQPFV